MKRKVPLTKLYPPILLHDPLSANVGQFHILVLWHKVAVAVQYMCRWVNYIGV